MAAGSSCFWSNDSSRASENTRTKQWRKKTRCRPHRLALDPFLSTLALCAYSVVGRKLDALVGFGRDPLRGALHQRKFPLVEGSEGLLAPTEITGSDGGERGIRTLDGITPKPHFQLDPEEGSEGFRGSPEVRCRCFEES